MMAFKFLRKLTEKYRDILTKITDKYAKLENNQKVKNEGQTELQIRAKIHLNGIQSSRNNLDINIDTQLQKKYPGLEK